MTRWFNAVLCRWCNKLRNPCEYGYFTYNGTKRRRPYCKKCINAKKREAWANLPADVKLEKHRRNAQKSKAKKYRRILNDSSTNRA